MLYLGGILKCDRYIDFRRQLNKYLKDKVFYSIDEFLNNALCDLLLFV